MNELRLEAFGSNAPEQWQTILGCRVHCAFPQKFLTSIRVGFPSHFPVFRALLSHCAEVFTLACFYLQTATREWYSGNNSVPSQYNCEVRWAQYSNGYDPTRCKRVDVGHTAQPRPIRIDFSRHNLQSRLCVPARQDKRPIFKN